jgi:subtilisin family serine protease
MATPDRTRTLLVAAVLLATALAAGCSGLAASGSAGAAVAAKPGAESGAELLLTLRAGNERIWPRIAEELAILQPVRVRASWFMRSLGEQCLVLVLPPGRDAAAAAKQLAGHARVDTVTVTHRFRLLGQADDPYVALQSSVAPLRLGFAHRAATGRGVSVAIIDTGLDLEHPDLVGRVVRAHDFVGRERGAFAEELHGTAVAGVVAARAGNGVGGMGVAPEADLWALRACWQEPIGSPAAVCDSYTLSQALDLAIVEGAKVINLSLAGEPDPLLDRLVHAALAQGSVVVAAAEGDPSSFPASIPGVIAVYGWAGDRPRAPSVAGVPAAALSAPSVDILTTVPKGGYDFVSGSSFSAAEVSGVVALILERRPSLSPDAITKILRASASATADGPLLVDACAALAAAVDQNLCGG